MKDFIAKSKKAIAGGVTTAVAAAGSIALTGGPWQLGQLWTIVGAFVVGFSGVWVAPANATDTDDPGKHEAPAV